MLSSGSRQAELLPSELSIHLGNLTEAGELQMRTQSLLICSKFNSIQSLQKSHYTPREAVLVWNMETK